MGEPYPGRGGGGLPVAGRRARRGIGCADHVQGHRCTGPARAPGAGQRHPAAAGAAGRTHPRQPRTVDPHRPHPVDGGAAHGSGQAVGPQRTGQRPARDGPGPDHPLPDPRPDRGTAGHRRGAAARAQRQFPAAATAERVRVLDGAAGAAVAAGPGAVAAASADGPSRQRRTRLAALGCTRCLGAQHRARADRAAGPRVEGTAAQPGLRRAVRPG
ncbi:hypothetical protein D3C71_1215730 [compost metagenome]